MIIKAFAGSNSSTSINKQLVTYASSLLNEHEIEILDLDDYNIPTFDIDIEKNEGFSDEVKRFYSKLVDSDILIISLAEHNACFSAVFKSYMDWCSRINYKFLEGKKLFVMSTSPGGYGGKNALEAGSKLLTKLGGTILIDFSLPKFDENFSDGKISNEELNNELMKKVNEFKNKI
ncbi:NAD(P)H-dependent oxidoreductase [Empedobacter falsenii]|uniref:NAD(P)H-dependent oxidoreductase n=1 Tax=Empedobacter stercoris TaxID=1628248 RepID=A0ABX1WIQ5_9FLAO|nr:NAD(P)H-dependent oxidoreductase [Empedobacter stercoris]MCA4781346.1 NAD(P)H-dependent oxidoreductase [Empedobacter stercoris]MCA4810566.1 NAD(P)H-dependent oxidoreductase [Empedobacter stercoris]NOJ74416.1 NAD(P)H-dependent oxidoreductase [Empedobacter stercoris]QNT14294.1 NAD(P)H-dependent oxidoreductase [Empedobacter stercoris]